MMEIVSLMAKDTNVVVNQVLKVKIAQKMCDHALNHLRAKTRANASMKAWNLVVNVVQGLKERHAKKTDDHVQSLCHAKMVQIAQTRGLDTYVLAFLGSLARTVGKM